MSNGVLCGSKFKQMGLGGGGENPRRQLILAVVLGVVVVATIVMVCLAIGKGGGGVIKGDLTFQCAECSELFTVDAQDLKRGMREMNAPTVVDCPKCDAENAGIFAIPCEKCGKSFARNSKNYMYEYWKENDQWPERLTQDEISQLEDDICPHCGANISEAQLGDEDEYEEEDGEY